MKLFYKLLFLSIIAFTSTVNAQIGSTCATPHDVTSLPFVQTGMTTAGSGDDYEATACGSDYMTGEDYVFTYTPGADQTIDILISNCGAGVGIFVMDDCPDAAPTCVDYAEGTAGAVAIEGLAVTNGVTYYIIISTYDLMGMNPSTAFDIQISEQVSQDGGVISIDAPESQCGLTATETVSVTIENFGVDPITSLDISFNINGGAAITETAAITVPVGGTEIYTFTATADLSAVGEYIIEAWTTIAGDVLPDNDMSSVIIVNSPIISTFPYDEDFETPPSYWSTGGDMITWELGAPAGTIINSASSGTNAWVTNLTGTHAANELSFLVSPCFDFTSLTNPRISFDLWYELTMVIGAATFEYSTDMGMSWDTLHEGSASMNWYGITGTWTGNAGEWISVSNTVPALAGLSNVKFRLNFNGGMIPAEGVAFDNFNITDCDMPDPTADFTYTATDLHVDFTGIATDATYYYWEFGDFIGNSTDQNPSYDYLIPGTYDVMFVASNDCGSDTAWYTIDITVGMDELQEENILIFPNPVSNEINILSNGVLEIRDVKGSLVLSQEMRSNINQIDVSALRNGIYFLRLTNDNKVINKKIVKE